MQKPARAHTLDPADTRPRCTLAVHRPVGYVHIPANGATMPEGVTARTRRLYCRPEVNRVRGSASAHYRPEFTLPNLRRDR